MHVRSYCTCFSVITAVYFPITFAVLYSIAGNGIESVLHITEVTDDDYDGVFKCLAFNVHTEQPSRLFRLKYSEYHQYQ